MLLSGKSFFSSKSQGIQSVSADRKALKKLQKNNPSASLKCLQVVHAVIVLVGVLSTICWVIIYCDLFRFNIFVNLELILLILVC